MSEQVVLVHGLWMRGFALTALGRRLRAEGFEVSIFDYTSVSGGPAPAIERLGRRLAETAAERLHVIGHSLGGLIALETLRQHVPEHFGRLVCLGSPLRGSRAAQRLALWPGGRALIGRSFELLRDGVAPWTGACEVGMVAGRLPIGIGLLADGLGKPNDGTVAVAETQLDGLAAHMIVPATHTGLVFSDEVARLAVRFLRHGDFAVAA